ncbi:MCE family protein [Acetobacter sacchari]|uniref:MCE family protein n=1 Tax=Acetobacter sacchari TaxID=2661687 RepID=A0ABS3LVD9_9PROT|nr:MlaD family protein [Acetobacter sacchari]MBO1359836.1 MCE family protein [Acetobacter sacchari]
MAKDAGIARQTVVGAFVIGGVALGLAALVLFGDLRLFSTNKRAVVVFQDSVSGLSVGAPVTFRGVRVGAVESIKLQYDQAGRVAYIPVVVTLDPKQIHVMDTAHAGGEPLQLKDVIAHGLRAEQNVQSFVTGSSNINLDFYPGSPEQLHPNVSSLPEIPTHLSAIQKIKETIGDLPLKELATNTNAAVISIRDLAEKLDTDIPPLVTGLRQTSDQSQKTLDAATQAITDLRDHLDVTLANVDHLLRSSDAEIQQRGADLHTTLASATRATDQARATLESVHGMLAPRGAERDNVDAALRDIAAAAASLRGFATDVERNPQLLLMGRRQ